MNLWDPKSTDERVIFIVLYDQYHKHSTKAQEKVSFDSLISQANTKPTITEQLKALTTQCDTLNIGHGFADFVYK